MIGCDYTYSILRFRGVPYHHLLDSVRFVAADRPHTINLSPVIPAPIASFLRAHHVVLGAIASFPLPIASFLRAHHVVRVALPSFPLRIPSFPLRIPSCPRLSRHSRCLSRHSSAPITSFALPSRHSWAYRVIRVAITSFPRRRESCGLFPKRIHRSTCATMNQTERPLLSSLLHCGEAGGHDAVYVDMMLSIEVEVVA